MVLFVAVFDWGAIGLVVGNFTGTLVVYVVLLAYRHEQLGLEFDRALLPEDAALRDAARPVGARAVDDQLRRPRVHRPLQDAAEVGVYSAR